MSTEIWVIQRRRSATVRLLPASQHVLAGALGCVYAYVHADLRLLNVSRTQAASYRRWWICGGVSGGLSQPQSLA